MPEGDTVHLTARRLHEALAGHALERAELRVPRFAAMDLSGARVLEVIARGKHLLARVEKGVTLHTHLGMRGTWHLYAPGQRWRGPGHEVRVVLETRVRTAVGFRLSTVEAISTAHEVEVIGHLGPDVLGPDWDLQEAVRRVASRHEMPIGEALLDQRLLAGVGNVYKSEVLWLSGIDPWTTVGSLSDLSGLVTTIKRVMEANRVTGRQIITGNPRQPHYVYGRFGDPCRRCGTPVRRHVDPARYGERVTYWCPRCQA